MRSSVTQFMTLARGAATRAAGGVARWLHSVTGELTLRQVLGAIVGNDTGDLTQPMRSSAAVYAAVRAISQTAASLPCRLYRQGAPDKAIEAGPAFELLAQPSPGLTLTAFVENWIGNLAESGESHIVLSLGAVTGKMRGLTLVSAREMQPRYSAAGELIGWSWSRPRATPLLIPLDEVITARLWNPYDRVRGLSPLASAALGVKQDFLAAQYNASLLANGGAPSGVYKTPDQLTREQQREWIEMIEKRHGGSRNAGRFALLSGGMSFEPIGMKAADLELLAGRTFSREEIFSTFGVPPVIASVFDKAHYDVADQSIEIFLMQTISPLLRAMENMLTGLLLPRIEPGVVARFDLSAHPVIHRLQLGKLDSITKAIDRGVPYNEAATLVGLPLARQTWGDTSLLLGTFDRAEDVASGEAAASRGLFPGEQAPQDDEDEESRPKKTPVPKTKEDDEEAASIQTAASVASVVRDERKAVATRIPRVRNIWRAHTERQLAILTRRLSAAMKHSKLAPAVHVDGDEAESIVKLTLLDLAGEKARVREMVSLYFPATAESSLVEMLVQSGRSKADAIKTAKRLIAGKGVRSLVRIQAGKIAGIEEVNRRRLQRQIMKGLGKGETLSEIRERMRVVLQGADGGSPELRQARINSIARNEVGAAVSMGRFMAIKASGLDAKSWRNGANPRDTHAAATARYGPGSPIPVDEAFEVGKDHLMFPRDPAGSAGEVVNCNCVAIPRRLAREEKKAS